MPRKEIKTTPTFLSKAPDEIVADLAASVKAIKFFNPPLHNDQKLPAPLASPRLRPQSGEIGRQNIAQHLCEKFSHDKSVVLNFPKTISQKALPSEISSQSGLERRTDATNTRSAAVTENSPAVPICTICLEPISAELNKGIVCVVQGLQY